MTSIFSKIIQRDIPGHIVYEDEYTIAILTINPINPGHTLIIPKVEINHFLDVPEPFYSKVFSNAKFIGQAIHKVAKSKRIGAIIQGLEVPHFHLHLVPLNSPADMDFRNSKSPSQEELKETCEKIKATLKEMGY